MSAKEKFPVKAVILEVSKEDTVVDRVVLHFESDDRDYFGAFTTPQDFLSIALKYPITYTLNMLHLEAGTNITILFEVEGTISKVVSAVIYDSALGFQYLWYITPKDHLKKYFV